VKISLILDYLCFSSIIFLFFLNPSLSFRQNDYLFENFTFFFIFFENVKKTHRIMSTKPGLVALNQV